MRRSLAPICWKLAILAGLALSLLACQPLLVAPTDGGTVPAASLDEHLVMHPMAGAPGLDDPLYPALGNGGYDVDHYTIVLDVDVATNTISGTTTIAATTLEDLSTFNLDFVGLEIAAVAVNEEPATFAREGQELSITPQVAIAAGTAMTVAVTYNGQPRPIVDPGVPFEAVGWLAYTDVGSYVLSEPSGAMNWFPNNNHPTDKATYTFYITVPDTYVVAANGLLVEIREVDGQHTYHWEASDPMASYLATVNIAQFDMYTAEGPAGLPIINFFPPDGSRRLQRNFAVTSDMIAYFSELVAPFPFESYGAIVMAVPFGGALEAQTRSVFGRTATVDAIIAHELAHQWFGDSVSPATWRDLWLNEGFATYFQHLWTEHTKGKTVFAATMRGSHAGARDNQLPPPGDPPLDTLFGPAVYVRGALTLHALRLTVGDDLFWDILRTYYGRYAGGNAGTADFIAVAEEVSGQDLSDFFEAWLYGAEVPDLPEGK
ncbi:MAG: M1 family metallopeptidase [Caldilineaceae bacterium]